jgi:hypothetical protein
LMMPRWNIIQCCYLCGFLTLIENNLLKFCKIESAGAFCYFSFEVAMFTCTRCCLASAEL